MAAGRVATGLAALKVQREAREDEERRLEHRRKGLLIMMLDHLTEQGYLASAECLASEAGVSLQRYTVADNMSFLNVLSDYEAYYAMRFDKRPKYFRVLGKSADRDAGAAAPSAGKLGKSRSTPRLRGKSGSARPRRPDALPPTAGPGTGRPTPRPQPAGCAAAGASETRVADPAGSELYMTTTTTQATTVAANSASDAAAAPNTTSVRQTAEQQDRCSRLLKPLALFDGDEEQRQLAAIVSRDIYHENPNVRWSDIAGLEDAKRLLHEAVVMPINYPQLFTGILEPWKGVLLFGPPGTGKTMLAKAVATECRTTFFNISASTIVSKWRGDSEKLVRTMFDVARFHAPATIFLDEIDAILGQRGGQGPGGAGEKEHEGSRRLKTEFLIQLDGLARSNDQVFVLCASNLPWELDTALLRRLEKRILVPLPNPTARSAMLRSWLADRADASVNFADVADQCAGFSGSDLYNMAKEAAMRPLRRFMAQDRGVETVPKLDQLDYGSEAGVAVDIKLDSVSCQDITAALTATRSVGKAQQQRYDRWAREFGSTMSGSGCLSEANGA